MRFDWLWPCSTSKLPNNCYHIILKIFLSSDGCTDIYVTLPLSNWVKPILNLREEHREKHKFRNLSRLWQKIACSHRPMLPMIRSWWRKLFYSFFYESPHRNPCLSFWLFDPPKESCKSIHAHSHMTQNSPVTALTSVYFSSSWVTLVALLV